MNYSASYLALTVLAILVGRMVVHGICWGGVGGGAVRLGARQGGHAGEARQDLQTLGSVTAGGHSATRLQPAGQWGKGKVSLGLMWDSAGVQQAHYLRGGEERVIRTEHQQKKTPASFSPRSYFTCGLKKNGSLVVYNKVLEDIFENVICFM